MPRRKAKTELTLFPFLSVLAGLIAVLMLFMIVTISTRVIAAEEKTHAFQKPAPPPEPVAEPPVGVEDGIDAESYEQLLRELEQLNGVLAKKQQEREELERKQQELLDLVAVKKSEILVPNKAKGRRKGVVLGEPTPVNVIPARGHTVSKKPILVEVSATGYIVHPAKTSFPPVKKTKGNEGREQFTPARELTLFLSGVNKDRAKSYVVFLVHPNGAGPLFDLLGYMEQNYKEVEKGWEPFSREWILQAK